MTDFVARRQDALEAERKSRIEYEMDERTEGHMKLAYYELRAQIEREQVQREKYRAAMAEKSARGPQQTSTSLSDKEVSDGA
jgi:major membrane immunogen (membrane-anchored lipoprotein)